MFNGLWLSNIFGYVNNLVIHDTQMKIFRNPNKLKAHCREIEIKGFSSPPTTILIHQELLSLFGKLKCFLKVTFGSNMRCRHVGCCGHVCHFFFNNNNITRTTNCNANLIFGMSLQAKGFQNVMFFSIQKYRKQQAHNAALHHVVRLQICYFHHFA